MPDASATDRSPRIAIIGGGFAGLSVAYYLKRAGIESFTIYEKAASAGGVWRENTYPGAACDVPSHLYSFSFEPHYPWSRRYGGQAEILQYQRHVARKFDLERHFRFGKEVAGAEYDAARGLWKVAFASGETAEAEILVAAVGQLHRPAYPDIPGMQRFAGKAFHSARWDHGCDFHGKTVAVIGSGASAVQFVPELARQAGKLYLFQRSPGWCIPKFDRAFNGFERWLLRTFPLVYDLDRRRIFWVIEFLASSMIRRGLLSRLADAVLRLLAKGLMWAQVRDPELRRKLTPDFPVGCKRTLLSNDWLRALARPNVEVVTERISEITTDGVKTADGALRDADIIVYGTGFAASQFLAPMDLKGADGQSLRALWQNGAEAYLGVGVAGFPNFFMLYGPNTNLGAGSIIYMLEAQGRYIAGCAALLRSRGLKSLEVKAEAQRRYNEEVQQRNRGTTYESGCHSWYIGPDGRNTNNWVGYMTEYGRRLKEPVLEDYTLVPAGNPVAA
ncbi:MAG TPA: NAD(P)/FAD-dependent oxidoreductase [Nevskia sp.]|nr:NAD(P)/FAD-dependent oxidoreductase [Nevskia sp.]